MAKNIESTISLTLILDAPSIVALCKILGALTDIEKRERGLQDLDCRLTSEIYSHLSPVADMLTGECK